MANSEDFIDTEEEVRKPIVKIQKGKWKNYPSVADLKADQDASEDGQSEVRSNLLLWEELRDGGKPIPARIGKSSQRPLVIRKAYEWKYPALEDPLLSTNSLFNVTPRNPTDEAAATQNGQMLNYQWNTKVHKTKLVGDIVRTVVDEGTVIVKTGWETATMIKEVPKEVPVYATPEQSVQLMQRLVQAGKMPPEQAQAMLETGEPVQVGTETQMVEEEVLTKNQPTYEVCINANVTIDPTCDGVVADAMFAIHEYDTSYAELIENEYEIDEEGNEFGFYHNIDYAMEQESGDTVEDPHRSTSSNNFEFKDKARRRVRAYEYWGYWDIQGNGELVGIVATWIGNVMVRLEENPFPHGRIPFSVATYMPVKRSVFGEPDAEILQENQESIGNMTRAINDIIAKEAAGQEFIDENFFPSPSQKQQYEKGNTVFYRTGFDPKKSIHRNNIPQLSSTPFDVIKWQTQDANELSGTKPFSGPGGAKDGGSANDRNSMDATAKRELSILRRLSDMLFVDMARMTISMNQVFLSAEEVIKVTDKEFVQINRDDLQGEFDLKVKVSTPERDDDQATKIMKLLQTNAASMSPDIVKLHYVQLAELWKLDKLAMAVKEQKPPEPDPRQILLMDLQLEEQKLKNALAQKQLEDYDSRIFERLSRTEENSFDNELKQAKADMAAATAEKIQSETDILDASFIQLQTGEKRREDIQDQQFKADVELAKEDKKTALQMAKEQFIRAGLNAPSKVINEI